MEEQDAEVSVPANDPRAASASVVLEEVGAPSNVEKKYAESELKHQSEEETKKRGRKRKEAEKESDEEKMASETTTKSTPSADREKIFHVFVKTLNGKTITLPLKWIGNTLEGLKFDDTNVKEEEEEEEEEEEIKGLEHVRYQELENLNDPKFDVRALLSNVLALRMKEREGWSRKFTKGLCQELFHFLELKATLGDFEGCEFSPPTSLMDDLWHEVILNTKLYRRLCATLPNNPNPGGKLIDHTTFGAVDLEVQRARTREKLTNRVDLTGEWDWSLWYDDAKPEVLSRTEGHFTVFELLKMIEAKVGVPANQVRLLYAGKRLEAHETFKSYNPEPEMTLHLVLKLCGC